MPNPSPAIRLSTDGGATFGLPGVKASVAAGGQLVARLDSIVGVDTCDWGIASTDDSTAIGDFTLAISGPKNSVCTFAVANLTGSAGILSSRINDGVDKATGNVDLNKTQATVKWFVPLPAGAEVGCAGEQRESDPTYGTTRIQNQAIRAMAQLVSPDVPGRQPDPKHGPPARAQRRAPRRELRPLGTRERGDVGAATHEPGPAAHHRREVGR
jgi:hypothetical protein